MLGFTEYMQEIVKPSLELTIQQAVTYLNRKHHRLCDHTFAVSLAGWYYHRLMLHRKLERLYERAVYDFIDSKNRKE